MPTRRTILPRRVPPIHPNITLDVAEKVQRWMERVQRKYPRHADRLHLDARMRLLVVDLQRGDVAAVRRNLAHLEAMAFPRPEGSR